MKKTLKILILILTFLSVSSISYAGDYSKQGLSFGAGGSIIFENFDTGISGLDFDESAGFNIKLGYRFNDHFEGEVDYISIDSFDGDVLGVKALEVDGYAITANGKWFSSTGKVQPYGLVGVGIADLEIKDTLGLGLSVSDSDFVIRFGGGLDAYVAENILLFVEASYYLTLGDIEDTDFIPVTVGAKYKF